jgi:hypothetical protein
MKAKETQEPPEHPLELTEVPIHGPNSHKSYEISSYGIKAICYVTMIRSFKNR